MDEMERGSVDIGFFGLGALGFLVFVGGAIATSKVGLVFGLLLMLLSVGYFALTGED